MTEIVGHAPIFLGLLLNNQNNNNGNNPANNNANNGNGTVIVHEQIAEVLYSGGAPDLPNHALALRLRAESPLSQVSGLTQTQCRSYYENGYLVVPNALTISQAEDLLNQAHALKKHVSEGGEGIIRHNVSSQRSKTPSPVGRILATFEPGDQAPNPFTRRIARLGCGVHQLPSFRDITRSLFNHSLASDLVSIHLGYTNPSITQSQIIAKLAGVGGRITSHQDGCVSFTDPPSCLTFWYALEDCMVDNGCLEVAAGTHLTEPLRQRLVQSEDGKPRFIDLAAPVWAQEREKQRMEEVKQEHIYTPLSVAKGTLILFHGNLLHRSGFNKSSRSRIAYTFSIVEGDAKFPKDSYMMPQGEGGKYERL
ncbi:MAG: hypothetical protein Q9187_005274 [Circinaria calcarea]